MSTAVTTTDKDPLAWLAKADITHIREGISRAVAEQNHWRPLAEAEDRERNNCAAGSKHTVSFEASGHLAFWESVEERLWEWHGKKHGEAEVSG